jgi:hypothetical protein
MKVPNTGTVLVAIVAFVASAGVSNAAESDPSLVREQKTVIVDGNSEIWRLQWDSKPVPMCGAHDRELALTCPCSGFAYGEQGALSLVRIRSDGETERVELGPLFPKDHPLVGAGGGRAILQRWAPAESGPKRDWDWDHVDDDRFEAKVARRPLSDIMKLADYDHDGQATEFLFQVDTLPCGKHQMVAVGVSKANPHLHIFSSAEQPDKPLILGVWEWNALRHSSHPIDVIDWQCDDHMSESQWKVHLSADAGVIHAAKTYRPCPVFPP